MDHQQISPKLKKEENISSDDNEIFRNPNSNFSNTLHEEEQNDLHETNEKSDNWATTDDIKSNYIKHFFALFFIDF